MPRKAKSTTTKKTKKSVIKNQHGEFETDQKNGRPTKWKPKYNKDIIKWFDKELTKKVIKTNPNNGNPYEVDVMNDFPTFQGFAHSIGVCMDTLNEWQKPSNTDKHPGFSASYKKAKALQERFWAENGLAGRLNTPFAIFWAKNNLGYKDKVENEVKVDGGLDLNVNIKL